MSDKQNQNSSSGNSRRKNRTKQSNFLESLRELGDSTASSIKNDLLAETSKDFARQMFGIQPPQHHTGEIEPGSSIEINDVFSGEAETKKKLNNQLALERRLRQEEKELLEKKSNDLRLELQALIEEITMLSQTTQDLTQEVQIAAMQAPVEPGVYHVIFFQKLLEFLKSYRQKVEEAAVWLHTSNKRAQKKNYWAKYKKHGSKFLLSPDHYLTRSAG